MGKKAEVGTPKYLANKMKAKGLQKLRWYCQMCQKQCRDENGFKCHLLSESHQRQILLFADNSKKYLDEFSFQLSKEFIQILRRQFNSKRVLANRVYQEYISDRNHVHMNSTRWVTLGGFVRWLGATGRCIIEETERGWYITYVEKDPETIAREKKHSKKIKMDKDDEERTMEFINKQVEMAASKSEPSETNECQPSELKRESEDSKIVLEMNLDQKPKNVIIPLSKLMPKKDDDVFKKPKAQPQKRTAIEELILEEEQQKEKRKRKDYWLHKGIYVKVITKSLGDEYYGAKGTIVEVQDKYTAIVKLHSLGKKLKLDQSHLETVIPAIGRPVKVVNGAYNGEYAKLLSIDEKNYCAELEISQGLLQGRIIKNVQYEDFSKIEAN